MTCPVTADTARSQPYEKNWLKVMESGRGRNIQMEYIREHILLLKQELDFQYGRIDTLFCPENLLDFSIQARSNFSVLDDILDFLIANGITPFFESRAEVAGRSCARRWGLCAEPGTAFKNKAPKQLRKNAFRVLYGIVLAGTGCLRY